jgi:TPR repeat protein
MDNAIIIEVKDKSEARFWLELACKTGNRAKSFNIKDIGLAAMIEKGMKTVNVSQKSVNKALL